MRKKDKKKSGWKTPRIDKVDMPYSKMKEDALEPIRECNNWMNCRDGFRDISYFEWKKRDKKKRNKEARKRVYKKWRI